MPAAAVLRYAERGLAFSVSAERKQAMVLPHKAPIAAEPVDTPPPFLGSWRRVYISVVLYLVTLILLFYAFRVAFER